MLQHTHINLRLPTLNPLLVNQFPFVIHGRFTCTSIRKKASRAKTFGRPKIESLDASVPAWLLPLLPPADREMKAYLKHLSLVMASERSNIVDP